MKIKIHNKRLTLTCVMLVFCISVKAQELSGTIRGMVYEKNIGNPIALAHVVLEDEEIRVTTSTDEQGRFAFEDVPLGRYDLFVMHVGYLTYVVNDLLIESGKKHFLKIALESGPIVLDDVEIQSGESPLDIEALGVDMLRWEASQRLAGTFYDPARLATTFPGVLSANDQANTVSIRGHSPNHTLWKVEGIDIINPNHLTNAGTLSDRPAIGGGGVSVLSAQLIDDSALRKGAYAPGYGNALAGIFDIHLRRGSRTENAFTVQAGFLGLEAASEGPIGQSDKSGYIASYRYSTIGLFDALGLDVSDESINFQDLSFKIDLETNHAGTFSLFGLGGLSKETFDASREPADWETTEDRTDTRFHSNMGGLGITHDLPLSHGLGITNKVAYSLINSGRRASLVTDTLSLIDLSSDVYDQNMVSWLTEAHIKLRQKHLIRAGISINGIGYRLESQAQDVDTSGLELLSSGRETFVLLQPYLGWEGWVAGSWKLQAGLHLAYSDFNSEVIPQPRLSVSKAVTANFTLNAHYGLVSQLNAPQAYFYAEGNADANLLYPNKDLKAMRSQQLVVGAHARLSRTWTLQTELYIQHHTKVPISIDTTSTYSILNATDGFINRPLTNQGTGRNMGIDILLTRDFASNWYLTFAGSVFDARYRAWDQKDRNTRFNAQFSSALSLGKEFVKQSLSKNRLFGFNMRALYHAGYWTTPINDITLPNPGTAVYEEGQNAFSDRLPAYFRVDARVYLKVNKKNYTRTLSLDIQNITNRKNISYRIYDPFRNSAVYQYQLGILPVLNYRVEF